jgi:branched-subunit amino acid aminotransferase/4-amino-4-deoxychorismate lyase
MEFFACGTAVTVGPIASITYKGEEIKAQKPNGEYSLQLLKKLLDIQVNTIF